MSKPISPNQVADHKAATLPDCVVDCWNEMIASAWNGSRAVIRQCDAVQRLITSANVNREEVFSRNYLEVEPMFRAAGWKVFYDKPGYNETYEPTFEFTKSK